MPDVVRAGGKDPFDYQKPTDDQTKRIIAVRQACKDLRDMIEAYIVPKPSRERSLALTKLEEVSMWVNKAIVFEVE